MKEEPSVGSAIDDNAGHLEGSPIVVLKTKTIGGSKVFVNICAHESVARDCILIGSQSPLIIPDKSGETCVGYDACVNVELLTDEVTRNEVSRHCDMIKWL